MTLMQSPNKPAQSPNKPAQSPNKPAQSPNKFDDDPGDVIAADSTLTIHRRHRRRRPVALALAVALVAGTAMVGGRELTAPRLSFDGSPTVWRTAPGDTTAINRTENVLGTEVAVTFERQGPFVAQLALVNHGRYPVRILGVAERGFYSYGLERMQTAPEAAGPFTPFRPFTLRRGATRWIQLNFAFADCDLAHAQGAPSARTGLVLDTRALGLHRHPTVPFSHFALTVPSGRCDHPVL